LYSTKKLNTSAKTHFSAKDFLPWYRKQLEAGLNGTINPEIVASCLPLGAWSQKKQKKMKKYDVFKLFELAYNLILRYN
jgi:hypothetical protein